MNPATTMQCLIPHDHAHPSPLAPPGTGHKQHEGHLRRLHGEESRIEIHKPPGNSMVSELRDVPASREHTQRFDVAGNPRNLCSFVFVTDVFQPRRAREVAKLPGCQVARLPGCQVARLPGRGCAVARISKRTMDGWAHALCQGRTTPLGAAPRSSPCACACEGAEGGQKISARRVLV